MEAGVRTREETRAVARGLSIRDYIALTKPKVQSLLLFTTITTMYVAGDPSIGLVALTVLGGYLSAGGAGAGHPQLGPRHHRRHEADGLPPRAIGARRAGGRADVRARAPGAVVPAAGHHGEPAC